MRAVRLRRVCERRVVEAAVAGGAAVRAAEIRQPDLPHAAIPRFGGGARSLTGKPFEFRLDAPPLAPALPRDGPADQDGEYERQDREGSEDAGGNGRRAHELPHGHVHAHCGPRNQAPITVSTNQS